MLDVTADSFIPSLCFEFTPPEESNNNIKSNTTRTSSKVCSAIAIEYLSEMGIIAISTSESMLLLWDVKGQEPIDDTSVTQIRPRYIDKKKLPFAALKLRWSGTGNVLFTFGTDKAIYPIELTILRPDMKVTMEMGDPLIGHTDMIQDIVTVDEFEILCSAGLDGNIYVWDADDHTLMNGRCGHRGGVRTLCYIEDGIMLSGGYDFDILAWDVSGASTEELFGLRSGFGGHKAPVEIICKVHGKEQVVSIDKLGVMKLWNVANSPDLLDADRFLQSFSTVDFTSGLPPAHIFSAIHLPNSSLICAGHKLHVFDCIKLKPIEPSPKCALFNPSYLSFMMAIDTGVRYFDGTTGASKRWFKSLLRSDVSALCLDEKYVSVILFVG